MRLMVIGSDRSYSIEIFYNKYLKEAGVELYHFPAQTLFYDHYYKSLLNKVLFKAGMSTIYKTINNKFKKAATEFAPDLIWIFKGMEIYPESLSWARNRNIRLVNFNADNPFIFSGSGSGNDNVTRSIGLYDLHFTYNRSIQTKLEKEYNARTSYLPFGYDISEKLLNECWQQEEVIRVCFLGNPDKNRAAQIIQMADRGIEIDVYGHRWQDFVQHKLVTTHPQIYGDAFWKTLYKYRVQLNIMRIHNLDSHNMRTFETPGIGGIQLAPDTLEHREFFMPGQEICLYKDIDDCCAKAKDLLALDNLKAKEIRMRAYQRAVRDGYSYQARALQALNVMKGLLDG